jgi:hypothetical protein
MVKSRGGIMAIMATFWRNYRGLPKMFVGPAYAQRQEILDLPYLTLLIM